MNTGLQVYSMVYAFDKMDNIKRIIDKVHGKRSRVRRGFKFSVNVRFNKKDRVFTVTISAKFIYLGYENTSKDVLYNLTLSEVLYLLTT